jgi:hypothetical protein
VVTPGATAPRIFSRIRHASRPARRIISISRRVLMMMGIGQIECRMMNAE